MKRIDTATRAIDLFGAGKDGFKDGNLALGIAPTDFNALFANSVQEEIVRVIEAAGLVPDGATLNQLLQAILKIGGGSSRVRGLVGVNNAGTPNTQFDFSAAAVDFRDPTSGKTPSVTNVGVLTNNVLTAGPAANGRDQAGAFSASSWLHFYFIYNLTTGTVATISSATPPPVGPTLPAGYTAWAYIGAVYFGSGSTLAGGYFRGAWFRYKTPVVVVAVGTQVLRTAVSLATVIPPNALELQPRVTNYQVQSNGAGTYFASVILEVTPALTAFEWGIGGTAGFNLNMLARGGTCFLPNIGQNLYYFHVVSTGSNQSVDLVIDGYSNPNGGE